MQSLQWPKCLRKWCKNKSAKDGVQESDWLKGHRAERPPSAWGQALCVSCTGFVEKTQIILKRLQFVPQERISKTDSLVPKHPRGNLEAAQIVQNRTADDVPRSVSVHAPQIIKETVDVVDIEQTTTQERVQTRTEEQTL